MGSREGLYDPVFEHDNCGIGAVVNIDGKKSHKVVSQALQIVENLEHRAGKDAEGKTGDGVGIFFRKHAKKPALRSEGNGNMALECSFSHRAS